MKVRFYSIQDLYDEVKNIAHDTLRMQFLTRSHTSEFKGGGGTSNIPIKEEVLTLTVASDGDVYYYSQPYFRCDAYDYEAKREKIVEKANELENNVRAIFEDGLLKWTIKKGVYEE